MGNKKIVGTVGELQFDVIQYRLKHEYKASCRFEPMSFHKACWLTADDPQKLADFCKRKSNYIATDKDDNPVFLAQTSWTLDVTRKDYTDIMFHETSEFKRQART